MTDAVTPRPTLDQMQPFEWLYWEAVDRGDARGIGGIQELMASRLSAMEDAKWQAARRLEVQQAMAAAARSIRDEFAARALAGIIACYRDHTGAETVATRSAKAWEYADEMIKGRGK